MQIDVWLTAATIGLPWLGGLAVLIAGNARPQTQHRLAAISALAAALAALALLPHASSQPVMNIAMGGVFGRLTFVPDGLGLFLAVVATAVGSLTVIFSASYMRGEAQLDRYHALALYFIGAMAGLALSGSLLFTFFFWEITAYCSYALISFHNDDPKAVAGGIKALLITQLGGIGLLILALSAYVWVGDYQISHFIEAAPTLPAGLLALLAFGSLVAAAAKSAQIPFQSWLPDAMEAPTPISALIHAATMINGGVYLLARLYPVFAPVAGWRAAVMVVGLLSIVLAGLMAAVTYDLKRVLAYSTISQLGYMVYAVGAGALFASQFHLLSHAVFKALLFLSAGAMIQAAGTRDMRAMGGLGRALPRVRLVFFIGALALMGVPPLNGFWSKELILEGSADQAPWLMALLWGAAGLTAYYTARCTWMAWFAPSTATQGSRPLAAAMTIPLVVLALATGVTWLLAGPFSQLLASTLPFHSVHAFSTAEMIGEILGAGTTYIALFAVMVGIWAWRNRRRFAALTVRLAWLRQAAQREFGLERVNQCVATWTQALAEQTRRTQTGQLSWNLVGLIGGLIGVLALLMGGTGQ